MHKYASHKSYAAYLRQRGLNFFIIFILQKISPICLRKLICKKNCAYRNVTPGAQSQAVETLRRRKAVKNGKVIKDEAAGIKNRKALFSNGIKHKDVALLYNLGNGKSAFGIYIEGGPNNKSGEITPAAASGLGIDPNPNYGGMDKNKLLVIIFPGSSKDFDGKTPTQEMINKVGDKFYQQNKELINNAIDAAKGTPTINPYD